MNKIKKNHNKLHHPNLWLCIFQDIGVDDGLEEFARGCVFYVDGDLDVFGLDAVKELVVHGGEA